tara:strand:- start:1333 stop:2415 length:1083 start_codon:yes stop_codon:yes gene_type:complete
MTQYIDRLKPRFFVGDSKFHMVREPVEEVPVIDLAPFVEGRDDEAKEAVAAQLREASINIGFFLLKNAGISKLEMDEALDWTRQLFDLPFEQKDKLHQRHSPVAHGWFPAEYEQQTGTMCGRPDVKEGFGFGRELLENDPMEGAPLMGPNLYPSEDVLPGFEPFMKSYMLKIQAVSEHLLHAFALSLSLQEDYFDAAHKAHYGFARMNYYPPVTEDQVKAQSWSCAAHTDYEGITILLQDEVGGLEVLDSTGDWIAVPPTPGMFVVNLGDLMAMWTNDVYRSTLHRVRNISGKKRYSLPYFYGPGRHATISCLPTCQGPGNPPKYPTTDVITHTVSRTAQNFPVEMIETMRGFDSVIAIS